MFHYRLSLPIQQIQTLNKGCTDIWCKNIVDRYITRPDNHMFDGMSLAEFCSYYRICPKKSISKTQQDNDSDDSDEDQTVYRLKDNMGYIMKWYVSIPAFNIGNTHIQNTKPATHNKCQENTL